MSDVYYAVAHRSQAEINSFKTRYQDFDERVIPRIIQKEMGYEVASWQRSKSWGSSHVIYFVNIPSKESRLVFRANLGFNQQPETVMVVEKLITDLVADKGIPTNRVLVANCSRDEFDFDYQIQEELVGSDIEDTFEGTQDEYDRLSYQLGQYVAQYHTISFDKFGRFDGHQAMNGVLVGTKHNFAQYVFLNIESDLKYLVEANVISKTKRDAIQKVFDDNRTIMEIERGVLIHHDLADHNIFFQDDRITGIFDWEACVVGDPVLDLASCPTWRTHYSREKQLLAGYMSVTGLPDNFTEKRNVYLLRTVLWKTVYAIRAGILDQQRKMKFEKAMSLFSL